MMKRLRIIAVLLAALGSLAGCGPPNEITLDTGDNGRQIELKKGQSLVITLQANPTTGYTWEVAEVEELVLRQKGDVEFQPESKAVGAGGAQTIRFEAASAGQTALKLVYHRPWEEGVEPAETFAIQVVVR